MEAQQLLRYIDNPDTLMTAPFAELEAVIKAYPYFQTARVLYLKKLSLTDSPELKSALEKNIIYCSDKRKLFLYLSNDKSSWITLMRNREQKVDDAGTVSPGFELIETFLRQTCSESEGADIESIILSEIPHGDYLAHVEQQSEISEYNLTPEDASQDVPVSATDSIIDSFLSNDNPITIKPVEQKGSESDGYAKKNDNLIKEEGFLTESLAKIYIKQKKYAKALEIIKKLSLKYPEKNVYFADQIRFLEKIITNIKTE